MNTIDVRVGDKLIEQKGGYFDKTSGNFCRTKYWFDRFLNGEIDSIKTSSLDCAQCRILYEHIDLNTVFVEYVSVVNNKAVCSYKIKSGIYKSKTFYSLINITSCFIYQGILDIDYKYRRCKMIDELLHI